MIRQQLPGVPIMALTATAAPQVTSIIRTDKVNTVPSACRSSHLILIKPDPEQQAIPNKSTGRCGATMIAAL